MKIKTLNEYWDKIEDSPYYRVASKRVRDRDGFLTEYTMYYNEDEDNYFFIFGDSDLYGPDPDYADWECDTNEEAVEWYNNYNGFEDEEEEDSFKFEEGCNGKDKKKDRLKLEESLFDIDIPEVVPSPEIIEVDIQSEPSKEVPSIGPKFGISTMLTNMISTNWGIVNSYSSLVIDAENNNMHDIAEVIKDISAEVNNHIGKLQAALATLSPNVENVSVGEEEASQKLEEV